MQGPAAALQQDHGGPCRLLALTGALGPSPGSGYALGPLWGPWPSGSPPPAAGSQGGGSGTPEWGEAPAPSKAPGLLNVLVAGFLRVLIHHCAGQVDNLLAGFRGKSAEQ